MYVCMYWVYAYVVGMYTCRYMYSQAYMSLYVYAYFSVELFIYVCIQADIYVCICIHTHIT